MSYDLVIGGAGLFGSTLAHLAHKRGKKVLVLENNRIGGLCADVKSHSLYGIHVFHTNDRQLWEWVNEIDHFIPVHHSPLIQYRDELYSFPINKLTLHQLGMDGHIILDPEGDNFEDACIFAVGETLYEKFFYHYTKKMWGREPKDLPASILKRLPFRQDYNTSYHTDRYVGVPEQGWTNFIKKLLNGVEIVMDHFVYDKDVINVFTGSIDSFYNYRFGRLPYRGLTFEEVDPSDAMQINYTDDRSYIREINYSYLTGSKTIRETPCNTGISSDCIYPVPWGEEMYAKYKAIKTDVIFAGRLGSYKYIDMNKTIENAIKLWSEIQ